MELNIKNTIFFICIILTALSAGIFYSWVVTVIPGTRKITDQAYLETMQSINREILNVGFFITFFGTIIFLIIYTYLEYKVKVDSVFYLTLTATIVYGIGTIGVTMFGNVPLNNVLEALDISSFSKDDFRNARLAYENKWNRLNLLRMVAALIAFILILIALIKNQTFPIDSIK